MKMNKIINVVPFLIFFVSCSLPKQTTYVAPADLTFKPEDFSVRITNTREDSSQEGNKAIYFDFEIKNLTTRDFDSRQYQNSKIYVRVNITATDDEAFSFEEYLGWYDFVIPAGTLKNYSSQKYGPNVIYIGNRIYKSATIIVFRKNT
jgi:hypothetical protein